MNPLCFQMNLFKAPKFRDFDYSNIVEAEGEPFNGGIKWMDEPLK